MHSKKTGIKGLILVLAGLVALAAIAVVPTFGGGSTQAGPGTGINLNRSAAVTEFIIPGVPVTTLATALAATTQPQFVLTINGNATDLFPKSGELLLGKTELVVYNQNKGCQTAKNEICITARAKVGTKKIHPVGTRVQLATQLTAAVNATTDAVQCDLQNAFNPTEQPPFVLTCNTGKAAAFGASGFLTIAHSGTVLGLSSEYMEYAVPGTCAPAPTADQLCIIARALQPGNAKRAHLADGFTQPCVVNNALGPSTTPACVAGATTGTSTVTKHFQLSVKSTAGFFPSGPLHVYSIDGGNNILGSEIISFNNAADKIKTPGAQVVDNKKAAVDTIKSQSPTLVVVNVKNIQKKLSNNQVVYWGGGAQSSADKPSLAGLYKIVLLNPLNPVSGNAEVSMEPEKLGCDLLGAPPTPDNRLLLVEDCEFHAVTRGGNTATFQPTAVSAHAIGSIVTGAHAQLVCRNGNIQPGVDTDLATTQIDEPAGQLVGTSVGVYPVCYTRLQPDGAPKTVGGTNNGKLSVPIIGSTLIVLNGIGVPFLSTGGINTIFGAVPLVDNNGTDDGSLVLQSPCITEFTPGTNLQVFVTLDTSDNTHATPDTGTIKVVLDTIPEGPLPTDHDLCDDPAGTAGILSATYSYYEPAASEDGKGANTCSDTLDNNDSDGADISDTDCYLLAAGATTHDTDKDGCSDIEELNPKNNFGGHRDPWNGQDFFDVGTTPSGGGIGVKDQVIDLFNDIVLTINAFANYNAFADHGGALRFGPFTQNRSDPDGNVDLFNDIVGVIGQFGHKCSAAP